MTPRQEYPIVKEFLRRYIGNMQLMGGQEACECPELIRAVIEYARKRNGKEQKRDA